MEFEKIIQSYLEQRAKEDSLFAVSFAKPNKSIKECFSYIMGEILKQSTALSVPGINCKAAKVEDEEFFSMAVHYYDYPNLYKNLIFQINSL